MIMNAKSYKTRDHVNFSVKQDHQRWGYKHRDSYGTTCLPGHIERFEKKEEKKTQKKI